MPACATEPNVIVALPAAGIGMLTATSVPAGVFGSGSSIVHSHVFRSPGASTSRKPFVLSTSRLWPPASSPW
jgi:hypothetical protein